MGYDSLNGQPVWNRKCDTGACVEVAAHHDRILIRSSKTPEVAVTLTRHEWHAFLADAKNGLYDELGLAA